MSTSTGLVSFNNLPNFSFVKCLIAGRTGRVGNPGKAISFVDGDYDAELLTKLIPLCLSAGVPIDDWMNEVAESGGGGGSDGEAGGGDDGDDGW